MRTTVCVRQLHRGCTVLPLLLLSILAGVHSQYAEDYGGYGQYAPDEVDENQLSDIIQNLQKRLKDTRSRVFDRQPVSGKL